MNFIMNLTYYCMENKSKNVKIDKFINSSHISEFLRDYSFAAGDIITIGLPAKGNEISYPVSGFKYIYWDIFVATDTCNHIYPYLSKYAIRKMMPQNLEWKGVKNPLLDYAKRLIFVENYLLQQKDGKLSFYKISENGDHLFPEQVFVNFTKVLTELRLEPVSELNLCRVFCPKDFDWPKQFVYSWTLYAKDEKGSHLAILCLLESGMMKIVSADDLQIEGVSIDLDDTHFLRTNLFYFKIVHEEGNCLIG